MGNKQNPTQIYMPRSVRLGTPLPLDPEIEKTRKKLRKQAKYNQWRLIPQTSTSSAPPVGNIWEDISLPSENESTYIWKDISLSSENESSSKETTPPQTPQPTNPVEPKPEQKSTMAQPEQTLREWARQDVAQEPLCITYPDAANFELKTGLIHLLPNFRGVENEDPHKFLKDFHVVCSGMKPHNVTEDQIKLRAFPFAVQDSARD